MLQDGPADGEMAVDERLLKQGGEAKTLHVACIHAVREQVVEKLLGRAADLLAVFKRPKMDVGNHRYGPAAFL
jgi:hypothetical protein